MLSARTRQLGVSPTLKVAMEADRLRRAGVDVIDFGAGEPDFPTPAHAKAAGRAAIDADFTKYTPNAGTAELKAAIRQRYVADYGVSYADNEIIATAGGKQALFNAALSLFGPGDDVVTHAPCWPTIPEQIRMAEARPILVRTYPEDGFRVHARALLEAITPRTRGIIINSPGNPTGGLITEDDAAAVAEEAARRDLWIVVDLCYEKLIYDPVPHNLVKVFADRHRDRTVFACSASKAYAMTGWRCGWILGPAPLVSACSAIQSHSTSNVSSISQMAAMAALTGPQACVDAMREEYRERRDRTHAWLLEDPRIRCVKPEGAFYLFPDVTDHLSLDGFRTSASLVEALLHQAHVAVTPGEAFDAPGFFRISYATSLDLLEEGVRRIHAFLGRNAEARLEH